MVQDQESWSGLTGHHNGDASVHGLCDNENQTIRCHHAALQCNGLDVCKQFNEELLAGCKRYEPDEEEMRSLWNYEETANAQEAGSVNAIVTR